MELASSLGLLVAVYALGLVSPGPNFIVVTATSLSVSRRAGLAVGLGVALASGTWALLSMVGVGLLLGQAAGLAVALRLLGALYLCWLGVKMIRFAGKPVAAARPVSSGRAFRRGYVVNMTNPKSLAFYGSIFALVIPVSAPLWFYGLVLAVCLGMATAWYGGLALVFSSPGAIRWFARWKGAIERGMGAGLVLLGGKLLLA